MNELGELTIYSARQASLLQGFLFCLPFYGAFFIGTLIRKFGLPKEDSPPLLQQLILCIPFSLVAVTPILGAAGFDKSIFTSQWLNFGVALGYFMIEGMFITEKATKYLQSRLHSGVQGNANPA